MPHQEAEPLFWGRSWLFRELASHLLVADRVPGAGLGVDGGSGGSGGIGGVHSATVRGVVISGSTGSGKTAAALQLVDGSCFGRGRPPVAADNHYERGGSGGSASVYSESIYGGHGRGSGVGGASGETAAQFLASRVVAYHFCQSDNSSTCLVADFVHSMAAQLCQAPQLVAYRQMVLASAQLQNLLSLKECVADPHAAFVNGILQPLAGLKRLPNDDREAQYSTSAAGASAAAAAAAAPPLSTCLIVVDALCEAEYHRPDYGDTIGGFLVRHALHFPHWLKVVVTVRTAMQHVTQLLPYATVRYEENNIQKSIIWKKISNSISNKNFIFANNCYTWHNCIRQIWLELFGRKMNQNIIMTFSYRFLIGC